MEQPAMVIMKLKNNDGREFQYTSLSLGVGGGTAVTMAEERACLSGCCPQFDYITDTVVCGDLSTGICSAACAARTSYRIINT
ncbi:hypothetical protein U1Q18_051654 [Sarracenia purpurea var. burkii]